jgi:hypothetical protein
MHGVLFKMGKGGGISTYTRTPFVSRLVVVEWWGF